MSSSLMQYLLDKAANLAGRPIEVVGVKGGYTVEWFAAGEEPPPVATSETGALEGFIEKLERRSIDPQVEIAEVPPSEENT